MQNIQLSQILEKIEFVEFIGKRSIQIKKVEQISNTECIDIHSICWSNDENLENIYSFKEGSFIVSININKKKLKDTCNYIIVDSPRRTFQKILELFFIENEEPQIHNTAVIDDSVKLGKDIYIGHNVVIEKNCLIGDHSRIGHNTVILKNTLIGKNVIIGSNNTIGGTGFGYEKNKEGQFELIPHIGGVIIEDFVEIGNNTCIDRAVIGYTMLKTNVKVDNLVHIAHGVIVGENTVVIANAMVGGSTIIGKNVWVAPSASLLNKISIADNALVGMSANVVKNVNEYDVVAGNPAKVIKSLKPDNK